MLGIEQVIDDVARELRKDPLAVCKMNFYGGTERNATHYHQTIVDNVIHEIMAVVYLFGAAGMVLNGRHSDHAKEERFHVGWRCWARSPSRPLR